MIFLVVITGLQALVNHFGIKLTAKLTDLSGYLIFAAALALTIGCLVVADHWDISRLWTFTNYSGQPADAAVWPESDSLFRVFLLGLLLPIYTITGYDASAHTSEEQSVQRMLYRAASCHQLFGHRLRAGSCYALSY